MAKAQVFTLDAVLALVLVIGSIGAANGMMRQHAGVASAHLQQQGSDIAAMLDETGYLSSLDEGTIEEGLLQALAAGQHMMMTLSCEDRESVTVGGTPPRRTAISGGSRFFMAEGKVCLMRWRIWSA